MARCGTSCICDPGRRGVLEGTADVDALLGNSGTGEVVWIPGYEIQGSLSRCGLTRWGSACVVVGSCE
jgi:hypothetical protein